MGIVVNVIGDTFLSPTSRTHNVSHRICLRLQIELGNGMTRSDDVVIEN